MVMLTILPLVESRLTILYARFLTFQPNLLLQSRQFIQKLPLSLAVTYCSTIPCIIWKQPFCGSLQYYFMTILTHVCITLEELDIHMVTLHKS